jgi:hypothetical protein
LSLHDTGDAFPEAQPTNLDSPQRLGFQVIGHC